MIHIIVPFPLEDAHLLTALKVTLCSNTFGAFHYLLISPVITYLAYAI